MRGWKNVSQANGNQKKPVVAIVISDKIDFKIKSVLYYVCIFSTDLKLFENKKGHLKKIVLQETKKYIT